MSRDAAERLDDIQAAVDAIRSHAERGPLTDALVSDAVRIRFLEIGEAVKSLPEELTVSEPDIPWRQIARMRDHLAHRYFMTELLILQDAIDRDLGPLQDAVNRMRTLLSPNDVEDADTSPADESLASEFARFDAHIAEFGWSVVYVAGGLPEGTGPSVAYSVGLTRRGLPELLTVGLDAESAHWLLNEAAALVVEQGGVQVGDDLTVNAGLSRLRVAACPVPERILLAAYRYLSERGESPVGVVQLVWEVHGAFPGDPGYPYEPWMQHPQPLAEPPA